MSNILEVTEDNFKTEVRDHEGYVLIDFWAPWCAPCRVMSPILEKVAEDLQGQIKVVKINVDENPQISTIYKIRGIPAFVILKNGEVIDARVGASTKPVFQMFVEQALGEENPV